MSKSAISTRQKMETLSMEVYRGVYNTRDENSDSMKGEIVTKLMRKMRRSGYTQNQRVEALASGVRRYRKMQELARKGLRLLHRLSGKEWKKRRRAKWDKNMKWFSKKKDPEMETEERKSKKMKKEENTERKRRPTRLKL